jgi:hypothetical protein
VIEFQIDGLDQMKAALQKASAQQKVLFADTMRAEAQTIMNESKKIVPVDTGALKTSGRVENPIITSDEITVTIGYGGPSAPYAEIVHEDPNAQHGPGKTFKYLEIPVMAAQDKFFRAVSERFITYMRRL